MQQQYHSDKSVGRPALCFLHGSDYPHIMCVSPATDYIVKKMSLLRSWVDPDCLFVGPSEESVGNHQVIFCTKGQQEEIIGINISKAMVSQHPFTVLALIPNSCIIVHKQEKLVTRKLI